MFDKIKKNKKLLTITVAAGVGGIVIPGVIGIGSAVLVVLATRVIFF